MNVLAATAVATELGVSLESIQSHATGLQPVARRGRSLTADGVRVIDDSYNASPAAVNAMIAALAATETAGRRFAVLGEMLELGDTSRALHAECGRAAAAAKIDELVAVGGPAAEGYIDGARAGGMASSRVHRFADSRVASAAVAGLVRSGDIVLVKGSRGTRMDVVADALAAGGAR
jgi:UDP-N-acetylmuramoyl-tripeptide--D-alanyl-D-alanine ligase